MSPLWWRRFVCSVTHHLWEPPVKHVDWFKTEEDIGEGGGNILIVVRGSPDDKDAWEDEYETRTCAYCGVTETL